MNSWNDYSNKLLNAFSLGVQGGFLVPARLAFQPRPFHYVAGKQLFQVYGQGHRCRQKQGERRASYPSLPKISSAARAITVPGPYTPATPASNKNW